MRITITGGAGRLGQALAAHWQDTHHVRTVDAIPLPDGAPSQDHRVGDLRDSAFAQQAIADSDVLVHLAPIAPAGPATASDLDRLDVATRSTYHLMLAAPDAGVQTVVLGSTLDLFAAYPGAWRVTEQWVPQPAPTPGPPRALSGRVQRARAGSRAAPARGLLTPRRGRLGGRGSRANRSMAAGCTWKTPYRLSSARWRSPRPRKNRRTGWWVYHITAAGPRTRVPLEGATDTRLGYAPRHAFRAWWTDDWQHPPATPQPPAVPSRPIRKVVVFGAGGPLAAGRSARCSRKHTRSASRTCSRWPTSSRPTSHNRRARRYRSFSIPRTKRRS